MSKIRKFLGTEECSTCIGPSNQWHLETGMIEGLFYFGEVEAGQQKSVYIIDFQDKDYFWLVQEKGWFKPALTTDREFVEANRDKLIKCQFVKVKDYGSTIVFELEGRGKITFKEIKK